MTLEKHMKAAAEALLDFENPDVRLRPVAPSDIEAARAVVNAALSSLADDPPEEMVEAAEHELESPHRGRTDLEITRDALSAALKEAGKGNDDG